MKPGLEIKVDNLNNIVVKDTTVYDSESSVGKSFSSFKQSETGSVFVLEYHRNNNDSEYLSPIIVNSHQSCAEYRIKVPKDGWFTIYHIILQPDMSCAEHRRHLQMIMKKHITQCFPSWPNRQLWLQA